MPDGENVPLAVVYSDGDKETNVGTVAVGPTLGFKRLLSLLSQKVGISPPQFSVFLANDSSDRKIPLTAKFNFAAVPLDGSDGDGGYYFLVRRAKRYKKSAPSCKNPPENVVLLRREAAAGDGVGGDNQTPLTALRPTFSAPPILDPAEYVRKVSNLCKERELFLMSMGINGEPVRKEVPNSGGGGGESGGAVCRQCLKAKRKGIKASFHLCVNDKVVTAFRTTAGPISRPVKNSGEDCS